MLVSHWNPYLVAQLSPEERTRYFELAARTVRGMEQAGMTSMEIGNDYPVEYYADVCHLTIAGSRRMAEDVAQQVRQLARRLGYTKAHED
jgi:hypothetical protein